jgi:glucose-1-phosphate thymidylyltransferase
MVAKGVIVVDDHPRPGARLHSAPTSPLLPVANRPIVFHVLDSLRSARIEEVAIVGDAQVAAPVIDAVGDGTNWGMRVTHVAAPTLRAAERFAGDAPLVIQTADGLLGEDLAPLLALVTRGDADAVLLALAARGEESVHLETERLARLLQSRADCPAGTRLAGLNLFGPGVLRRALTQLPAWPRDAELSHVLAALCDVGGRVTVRRVHDWRRYTGDVHDLLELNRALLDDLDASPPPEIPGSRIQGRVAIDPTATIEASVIRGPVIVGPGARISDAFIGPHTSIGANVVIEGAEIEHSIILPGAAIMHIGGRVEASVVGRDARIVRDFSLPRALRLNVGDGVEVLFS